MSDFGYGYQTPWDTSSEFNAICFVIRGMMAAMDTMKLVRVQAVQGGGVGSPPTVDVLPLVQQVDGNANVIQNGVGVVYGVPVARLQGGPCAIIVDPAEGDVGYVVASDRDVSSVIATPGEPAAPASFRRFSIADGVYAGGVLNETPTCYLRLTEDGFALVDANGNAVESTEDGMTLSDANGNEVRMAAAGVTILDGHSNQIQTRAGFVNVVTASFQVNGVPVTVP